LGVPTDAVSPCTVHPHRPRGSWGMSPDADFAASGHGSCHRPYAGFGSSSSACSEFVSSSRFVTSTLQRGATRVTSPCVIAQTAPSPRRFARPNVAGRAGSSSISISYTEQYWTRRRPSDRREQRPGAPSVVRVSWSGQSPESDRSAGPATASARKIVVCEEHNIRRGTRPSPGRTTDTARHSTVLP
jgi:hypothetical protein